MGNSGEIYHTALKGKHKELGNPINEFLCDHGVAFTNNLCVHQPVFPVDVVYSEPAWRPGYNKFKDMAGDTNKDDFDKYIHAINKLVHKYHPCPVFVLASKTVLKKFKPPHDTKNIKLVFHDADALLLAYNTTIPEEVTDTEGMVKYLARKYNSIYDFSCGYAESIVELFGVGGKRFYLSDINGKCIGYIKDHYERMHNAN